MDNRPDARGPLSLGLPHLGKVLRGSLHHHCHHAVVLMELIYFLDTLLDQEFEGHHRAERVQNSEVSYVRYLIGRS